MAPAGATRERSLRRFLIVLVLGVVALAAAVELAAPSFFEARIEEYVRERTPDVAVVSADVDSFPVVTRLLTTGRIRRVTLTFDELVLQRLRFANVRLVLDGLGLDRSVLLRRQEVELESIRTGTWTAELTSEALSSLAGVPLELHPGQVSMKVAGATVSGKPEIRGRSVRLGGRRVAALDVILPDELASCTPDLEVQLGRMVLTCRIEKLPGLFTARRT